jgi:hypothetical protein
MSDIPDRSSEGRRRVALMLVGFWVAGMIVSVFIAWGIAYSHPDPTRGIANFVAVEQDQSRTVNIVGNWVMRRATVNRSAGLSWAPQRAAGPPDTNQMGDISTAWASDTPDGQAEWLELEYAQPVKPVTVRIFETYNPGALNRITCFSESGVEIDAWTGADPAKANPSGIFVADVAVSIAQPITRIRLYIDSKRVPGWNEIDAVGLVDANGTVQWAQSVRASSTYAARGTSTPPMTFAELQREAPRWVPWNKNIQGAETFEAYGWPALAVATPVSGAATGNEILLPIRPVWRGLAINGVFYGSILAVIYLLSFRFRRFLRESIWLRRGCCMQCGYDLRFDLANGCPECGWRREAAP